MKAETALVLAAGLFVATMLMVVFTSSAAPAISSLADRLDAFAEASEYPRTHQ